MSSEHGALDVWKEKLEFLRVEEAKAADPAQKFKIAQDITKAEAKIAELDGGGGKAQAKGQAPQAVEIQIGDRYVIQGQAGAVGRDARAEGNVFEQARGERPPSAHRDSRVAPSRLTHSAAKLFGREDELARLEAAWNEPQTHVVTLVAWGGVGKTSLVAAWAAELAARDYDGADYFDWSFYSQGTREVGGPSSDAFVNAALRFFGDAEMAESKASAWDKGARLVRLVTERRTLLVLDGLEPLQHPPGPLAGELKDPALKALLKGLAAKNSGLCVVTTRVHVKDLAPFRDNTAPEHKLGRLSVAAGVKLLEALEVHGAEGRWCMKAWTA